MAFQYQAVAFIFLTVLTSVPFFIKYLPGHFPIFIGLYSVMLIGALAVISSLSKKKFGLLEHNWPWLMAILALLALNFMFYSKTRLVDHPSTAPNALVEPAMNMFLKYSDPYSVTLFDRAPISPGPGWLILNAPLSLANLIPLLNPIYAALAAWMISLRQKREASLFVILLMSSLCYLQMSVVGDDLPAITCALVSLTIALRRYHYSIIVLALLALLTGFVSTARIPLGIAPLVLGACLMKIDRAKGIRFAILATVITLLLHGIFYCWSIQSGSIYQPLHVFGRGYGSGSAVFLLCGFIFWIAVGHWNWAAVNDRVDSWLVFLWGVLAVPFMFVGIGELFGAGVFSAQSWASWEGKRYVFFTSPLLIAALSMTFSDKWVLHERVGTQNHNLFCDHK